MQKQYKSQPPRSTKKSIAAKPATVKTTPTPLDEDALKRVVGGSPNANWSTPQSPNANW